MCWFPESQSSQDEAKRARWPLYTQWIVLLERNAEFRELELFIILDSKHACTLFWRKTPFLSSKDVHYTSTLEKKVQKRSNSISVHKTYRNAREARKFAFQQDALISPIINKNLSWPSYPLYPLPHLSTSLYSHSPQVACPWLLTQIDLLFSLEHTTIRFSPLNSFVKATDDVPVLNPKLTFLFIFLDPSAEFDTTDHSLLTETSSSLKFQDNITFLFCLLPHLLYLLSFSNSFFSPIFHQAGVSRVEMRTPSLFYLSGQISIPMPSLYHQDWIYITLYYPELWF